MNPQSATRNPQSNAAGPESRPHISSIRLIKIAVGVANQPGSRRPTASAQNFMIAEPWRGVFFVRAGGKARVRAEIGARPFPHIADHLTDAERAVVRRQCVYRDASAFAPIQVRSLWRGRFVAPRIFALAQGDAAPVSRRFTARRHLPFGLGRQSAFGPPAIGFGLIPVDVDHRQIGLERNPLIENSALPVVFARGAPVNWMRGARALAPAPALIAPQFAATVTGVVHKLGEFGLGDRRPRD